jgi:hypothetical protein
MHMFFEAVHQQALYRASGIVPDFDTFVELRRETSGCKPVFDLIEYSLDLELSDAIVEHPVIAALNNGANDLVTWSNVSAVLTPLPVASANKERSGPILVQCRAISRRYTQPDLRLYE